MHGLINRAIQGFVSNSYGDDKWLEVTRAADMDFVEFEAMLTYDDALTSVVLDAVAKVLDRPRYDVMEDIGTYLVSNPKVEGLRRLLRFGGENFVEFLHSLDELPERARLAVSDLDMPRIELHEHSASALSLHCESTIDGYGYVLMGVLRAMADDYGVLALLEHSGGGSGNEVVSITLVETDFAAGRSFELGAGNL